MVDLVLSVLCSSVIFVIFRLFNTYKIDTLYAIITNYFVASLSGILFYSNSIHILQIPQKKWFGGTFVLGMLFILVFNLMAITAQKVGVAVASVAAKMSLVIPVIFGVVMYGEELGYLKILGIVLALAAVYFTSFKEQTPDIARPSLLLPFLVFLGSGIIDTCIKYVQEVHISESEFPLFSAVVFAAAATTGSFLIIIKSFKKRLRVNFRNVIGGIALGIPNYFSIFFLLRALQNKALNSASIFTINNVAVVMLCTLLAILLFKEKISSKNWFGIGLAILSILLVAIF